MIFIGEVQLNDFPVMLAPMEDVTDAGFRILCKEMGADVVFTEFVSSEGLVRDVEKSNKKILFNEKERPIGIQIFGNNEESMVNAAQIAEKAKPDFIDINWGCPVRKIAIKGAGAGILNDIPKMISITKAMVDSVKTPITVKTRLGWDAKNISIVETAERLQDIGIKAITVHGRTKEQLYSGDADWVEISKVKENKRLIIPVFGNGDIISASKALEIKSKYTVDGIMVGRGAIGNPWIFREIKSLLNEEKELSPPSINERIDICKKHFAASVLFKGERTALFEMRAHYSTYFRGISNFKPFRIRLVTASSYEEIESILEEIKDSLFID